MIHVEDEQRELYDRLVPLGISPGTRLTLRESRDGRLRIETDGREIELDLATAGNVTVRAHEDAEPEPAYEIRGALIALRREQQRWVRIVLAQEQAA